MSPVWLLIQFLSQSRQTSEMYHISDGIYVHITMEGRGTVTDRYVVDRASGSWKSELGVEVESERLRAKAAELRLRIAVRERDHWRLSDATELRPQSQEAPGRLSDFSELTAVLCLRDGSRVTRNLSVLGLVNVVIPDWSHEFMFVVGDHHYRSRSSVAQFLSPRVSSLHWIDATISEVRLEVEGGDKFVLVPCWKLQEAALQLIQFSGQPLRRFALLSGIHTFLNMFSLSRATVLR
jgi:hypothetical protein